MAGDLEGCIELTRVQANLADFLSSPRLIVAWVARRGGRIVGHVALHREASRATARGLTPALDVVTSYAAATALYEREGWRRLGTITAAMPDGNPVDEYVHAAPT